MALYLCRKTLSFGGGLEKALLPGQTLDPAKYNMSEKEVERLLLHGSVMAADGASAPAVATPKKKSPVTPTGPRNMNPKLLKGKDLDQLNAMVIERGGDESYETPEEAIAFLSEHFTPGTKVLSP